MTSGRRSKDALRKKKEREAENESAKAERLRKARERAREVIGRESQENRDRRLRGMEIRMRAIRAKENQVAKDNRIRDLRERSRSVRAHESRNVRNSRLHSMREHARSIRADESMDERESRLSGVRERVRTIRADESMDERESRLSDLREHARSIRAEESTNDREIRLRDMCEHSRLSRSLESEEERQNRLQVMRLAAKKRRRDECDSFQREITDFADQPCTICRRMLYTKQRTNLCTSNPIAMQLLPTELCTGGTIVTCNRCSDNLKKGKLPPQSYWNKMEVPPIPPCIQDLSQVEKRLLSRVVPFLRIMKMQNRLSQEWCKGQLILFAQDVAEVAEQLPLPLERAGLIIVTESLENVQRQRRFQINLDRLKVALNWLLANNPLYRDVRTTFPEAYNLEEIVQVIRDPVPRSTSNTSNMIELNEHSAILRGAIHQGDARFDSSSNTSNMIELNEHSAILRGAIHQGDARFDSLSRGKQCTAVAAVAIIAMALRDINAWAICDVDLIVLSGDRYYIKSKSESGVQHDYLTATDLSREFTFDNTSVSICIQEEAAIYGHISIDHSDDGFPNLINGIRNFFESHSRGILTANSMSVAIMTTERGTSKTYWLFDSHARGPKGFSAPSRGTACCMRFYEIEPLYNIIRKNFFRTNESTNERNPEMNLYTITPIVVNRQENVTPQQNETVANHSEIHINQTDTLIQECEPQKSHQENVITEEHPIEIQGRPFEKETDKRTQECDQDQNRSRTFSVFEQALDYDNQIRYITSTSMLRAVDDMVPNLDSVVDVDENEERTNIAQIRRKTAPPLNLDRERRMEELAWYYLFPDGRNGFGEIRDTPLTALDYFQARVMGDDKRFKRNDYLFFALSVVEYYRAKSSVGVCCRLRQGEQTPQGLVDNIHLAMRNVRGSAAYWSRTCAELIAMIRNLGPPTWFVTFSCNDLNWVDMLQALCRADGRHNIDVDNLTFEERLDLVERYPITLSRQFMVRVYALLRFLKSNDSVLGGKMVDWWLRIEFQNRGSPHIHMLIWCCGVPDFSTLEGIQIVDQVVSCSLPDDDQDLKELVKKVQIHKHTPTCYKNQNRPECRFGFPRSTSSSTVFLDDDQAQRNKGRVCNLRRTEDETMINNYNATLLNLWDGNMDIQPCGNISAVAYYVAKYASKSEPSDCGDTIREAIRTAKRRGGSTWQQMFSVSMAVLSQRLISAPECAFRLCHLPMKIGSRKAVFINSCRPEQRFRMLRLEGDDNSIYNNIFDRYEMRPEILQGLSLAEFAVRYEPTPGRQFNEDDGDEELQEDEHTSRLNIIKLMNGTIMRERRKAAVLRHRHYTLDSDRDAYFYSLIVCHVPFRRESELLLDDETAEQCFLRRQSEFRPLQANVSAETFAHEEQIIQQALAQAAALRAANVDTCQDHTRDVLQNMHRDDIVNVEEELNAPDEFEPCIMSDDVFLDNVQKLNVQQRNLFKKISSAIEKELRQETVDQVLLFITGGAGSGKSFLLKLIVELIRRCYAPTVDPLCNPIFAEVAALTGVAARQISGRTLHSIFSLPVEKGKTMTYKAMTGNRLEQERRKWRSIKWLIIDEISMVSYELLRIIHLRLQEYTSKPELYGGINVLLFGDLMQLPPVNGHWCFTRPPWCDAEVHLWQQFSLCELTLNMRQRNDSEFIDLLNSLRFGQLTTAQLELLLERTRIPMTGTFEDGAAVRIFPTLNLVDQYNDKMSKSTTNRIYCISAVDESREPATYGKTPPDNVISKDINKCGGLAHSMELSIGSRVMLRRNISVRDGLVNGTMGVIKQFKWPALRRDQIEDGELPDAVIILFDDPTVGERVKDETGFVRIAPVTVTFQASRGYGDVERRMLPLILSWAVTVHKLQGTTMATAVVNLSRKLFAKGQAYVALSRVKTLDGLAICELDPVKLLRHPHDERAHKEMQRLRSLATDTA